MVGRNILIVDDDEKIVDLIQTYLKKDDYRVLTAYNGLRALELARQSRPDLIVLDLMLPGMDGFETCREIRKFETLKEVPIIMVTMEDKEVFVKKAILAGTTDYILKPINYKDLLEKIDKHMWHK